MGGFITIVFLVSLIYFVTTFCMSEENLRKQLKVKAEDSFSKRKHVIGSLAVAIICGLLLIVSSDKRFDGINRAGYFSNDAKQRVYVETYKPNVSDEKLKQYASNVYYTPGSLTWVFFYPEGVENPGDRVTRSLKYNVAINAAYDSKTFTHVYLRSGIHDDVDFVNCIQHKDSYLCEG